MDKNFKNIAAIRDFMGQEEGICKVNATVHKRGCDDVIFQNINFITTNETYTTRQFSVGIYWEEDISNEINYRDYGLKGLYYSGKYNFVCKNETLIIKDTTITIYIDKI